MSFRKADLRPAWLFLAVALLLRGWLFGNPVIHIDEQFYLVVGDRMLGGVLPYVDIWDRKPIGLFLIYAFASLFGDGILAYQLLATLSAVATAWVVYRIALRIAAPAGAAIGGVAYLLYLLVFNGAGGQAPVFYTLLVSLAALATLRLVTVPAPRHLLLKGAGIMLLLGVAMQVKYTVLFEGAFFGLALLWRGWRDGRSLPTLAGMGLVWVACALLPTGVAYGVYVWLGHGAEFVQANFVSVFGREQPWMPQIKRLGVAIALLLPFWLALFVAPRVLPRPVPRVAEALPFVRGWAVAAIVGFLAFRSWGDHYGMPLAAPLAVIAAPMLGLGGRGRWFTGAMLGIGLLAGGIMTFVRHQDHGSTGEVARLTALIQPRLQGGCLFLFDGDPILYQTTGACFATRYVFTSHLTNATEAKALGVDPAAETRRILASAPSVVVMTEAPKWELTNTTTRGIVEAAVARDYVPIGRMPVGVKRYLVYARAKAASIPPPGS
jgi:4-amino-4-deoxy-L-arabinose transferase-like glycosyltransferase